MNSAKPAHLALKEAAGLLGLQSSSHDDESGAWRFTFDSETRFDIEPNAEAGTIVIQADIAAVADDARSQLYEMLLQYNYLWTQTGGVRMALGRVPGPVVMMFEMPAAELEVSRICGVLANMTHVLQAWREILRERQDG
ncbi:MAG: hypothetical protein K0Q43_1619 [Ramlibacter sp.]|nr:hypothetical protein [Ramlibacter sp.]